MLLSCQSVAKAFATTIVLQDVSFIIEEREKAAVIGVNGAGKTTLFKILTGELAADGDSVISLSKGAQLGYMAQLAEIDGEATVYDEMLAMFRHVIEWEDQLRKIEAEMAGKSGDALNELMEEYGHITHLFEENRGYEYKSRIRGVLKGLGFSEQEFSQPLYQLSGGQKTRVALGKLLLSEPELLLLDEPTNHLDMDSIRWLEDFLKGYPGGILIISHDRYFLDRIVTKVIEIENGKSAVYNGNYTFYAHKKEVDREIAWRHYFNQQKEIKRQEDVITKLRSFNREKSIKRAESREKLLDKMDRVERPDDSPDKMRFSLEPKRPSGFDVLTVRDLKKSFDNTLLFENVSFDVKKPEKVALIGPNGIGKTTLFRIILGTVAADSGKVTEGSNVRICYYDQEHENIDPGKTIFQEVYDAYPRLTVLELRNSLAAFMFTGDDVNKKISTLSGGERGRVALAKIMLGNANFLILDEPTNHLDIYSKEILEQALRSYGGTVLYISHDRYFINNTAEKIVELSPIGAVTYAGNYDYYLEKKSAQPPPVVQETTSASKDDRQQKKRSQAEDRRARNQIQRLESRIAELEQEIRSIDEMLLSDEVSSNYEKASELYGKKTQLEEELSLLYDEWADCV